MTTFDFDMDIWEKETKLPQELFDDIDKLEADEWMYRRCCKLYERYEFRKVEEIENTMTPIQFARIALDMRETWYRDTETKRIRTPKKLLEEMTPQEIIDILIDHGWWFDDQGFIDYCVEIYQRD